MPRSRRLFAIWLSVLTVTLVVPSASYAEGGGSIATAPTVAPGQQEFGNLADGSVVPGEFGEAAHVSWWLLSVTVGDQVVIDWEQPQAHHGGIIIYPVGTTDYNYQSTSNVLVQEPNSTGKNEAKLEAKQSGDMPLEMTSSVNPLYSGVDGPYSFTVYITHALNVALPRVRHVAHHGHLTIAVHNPEGGPISDPTLHVDLEVQRTPKSWQSLGSAIVSRSTAHVAYTVPEQFTGQDVMLRATAHGPGYVTTSSRSVKVHVR